jgi:hypothetical protein
MSDSDFTAHETDEFTEEDYCENGVDCITLPLEPNDFVLLKLATKKKPVKYIMGLIQELGPDSYNTRFLRKQLIC